MATVKKEYLYIDPKVCVRAVEHMDTFVYDGDGNPDVVQNYPLTDRINPAPGVDRIIDGKSVFAVLGAWKYVHSAQLAGIEKIFVCKLTLEDDDDLVTIMCQLQRSTHDSFIALFMMIQKLWPKYYKGKGFRADLTDDEIEQATETEVEGKKLNIYQLIGKELFLSGNKVKHLRKVGMINPLHFSRIETGRFTLYTAYLECVKQEQGVLPVVPGIKPPTYITTPTSAPQFTEPTTTAPESDVATEPENTPPPADEENTDPTINEGTVQPQASEDSEFIIVRGICQCCHEETEIKINKNQIK